MHNLYRIAAAATTAFTTTHTHSWAIVLITTIKTMMGVAIVTIKITFTLSGFNVQHTTYIVAVILQWLVESFVVLKSCNQHSRGINVVFGHLCVCALVGNVEMPETQPIKSTTISTTPPLTPSLQPASTTLSFTKTSPSPIPWLLQQKQLSFSQSITPQSSNFFPHNFSHNHTSKNTAISFSVTSPSQMKTFHRTEIFPKPI